MSTCRQEVTDCEYVQKKNCKYTTNVLIFRNMMFEQKFKKKTLDFLFCQFPFSFIPVYQPH